MCNNNNPDKYRITKLNKWIAKLEKVIAYVSCCHTLREARQRLGMNYVHDYLNFTGLNRRKLIGSSKTHPLVEQEFIRRLKQGDNYTKARKELGIHQRLGNEILVKYGITSKFTNEFSPHLVFTFPEDMKELNKEK